MAGIPSWWPMETSWLGWGCGMGGEECVRGPGCGLAWMGCGFEISLVEEKWMGFVVVGEEICWQQVGCGMGFGASWEGFAKPLVVRVGVGSVSVALVSVSDGEGCVSGVVGCENGELGCENGAGCESGEQIGGENGVGIGWETFSGGIGLVSAGVSAALGNGVGNGVEGSGEEEGGAEVTLSDGTAPLYQVHTLQIRLALALGHFVTFFGLVPSSWHRRHLLHS
eukprot:GGOE01044047.1.p3 GENE.GGOE01044047.1~~GGOE01044047.1.p3  ORF type:complete len:224 (-),score=21.50 GGOE01044047.1:167-838(-)